MPVRATSSATASPLAGAAGGVNYASRVRSASPSRRALAIDMRHIASLLRDTQPTPAPQAPPVAAPGDASVNTSICSSPHTAWEPGDRGAAPVRLARSPAAAPRGTAGLHHQFSAVAEKVNVVIAGLQRQCDTDRRRISQLERKLEARAEERAREGENRVNFAELQGSVNGLIEEMQGLTRRMEVLDERLWARTSGSELTKQKNRELEQQVQTLEQQSRMSIAASEETQKRQATKIRRMEHALEELTRRVSRAEEESRQRPAYNPAMAQQRDGYVEARLGQVENQQEQIEEDLRQMQMQIESALQGIHEAANARDETAHEAETSVEDAVQAAERACAGLEKKVSGDIEDIRAAFASMKVKVDRQHERVGALAERMETAHEPAIEALRAEMTQVRLQDRRELDGEVVSLKARVQEAAEGTEEVAGELREALRQARAEIAALSLRPEESPAIRSLDERLIQYEREVCDMRNYIETLPPPLPQQEEELPPDERVDDEDNKPVTVAEAQELRRRLEWLEEQNTVDAATEKADNAQVAKVQNTVCDLVEQVSRLKRSASNGENKANAVEQQVQQIQLLIERRNVSADLGPTQNLAEVEAKVGAVSQQVADLAARLLEVEGGLDFARESGEVPTMSRVGEASAIGTPSPAEAADAHSGSAALLQEKLEAIAEHLEALDELNDRVAELERKQVGHNAAPAAGGSVIPASPMMGSEVSFGGDAPVRAPSAASLQVLETLPQDVGELREKFTNVEGRAQADGQRLTNAETKVQALSEGLTKQEAISRDLERQLKDFSKLQGIPGTVNALDAQVQEALAGKELAQAVQQSLDELRVKVDKAASVGMKPVEKSGENFEELAEVQRDVTELRSKLQAMDSTVSTLRGGANTLADATALSELSARVDAMEKRTDPQAQAASDACEKLGKRCTDLEASFKKQIEAHVQDLDHRLQQELEKTNKSIAESSDRFAERHAEFVKQHGSSMKDAQVGQQGDFVSQPEFQDLRQTFAIDLKAFERRLGIAEEQLTKQDATEDKARAQVAERVEELTSQVKQELANLAEQQEEIVDARSSIEALSKRVVDIEKQGAEGHAKGPDVGQALTDRLDKLTSRIEDVEETNKKSAAVASSGSDSAQEVEAIKRDVSNAKATLDEQIKQLEKTKNQLAEVQRKSELAEDDQVKQLAKTKSQLAEVQRKAESAEDTAGLVKKDLDLLCNPKKVGISPGSSGNSATPLSAIHDRLEELTGQVDELREKMKSGGGQLGIGGHAASRASEESGKGDASLNFSLTEAATERLGGSLAPAGADDSLNFSLTNSKQDLSFSESLRRTNNKDKAALRGGMASGIAEREFDEAEAADSSMESGASLAESGSAASDSRFRNPGFDPTATSKDPLRSGSKLGDLPSLGGPGSRRSPTGGDVLDSLLGGGSAARNVGLGGSRTSPDDDDLDDDIEDAGGDKLSGRPRPPPLSDDPAENSGSASANRGLLAAVPEEGASDAGDQSLESRHSQSSSVGLTGSGKKVTKAMSPANLGMEAQSPAGSTSHVLEASLVSNSCLEASCHEISVAPDYSVEDSLELEKCDHWEPVQPSSPAARSAASSKESPAIMGTAAAADTGAGADASKAYSPAAGSLGAASPKASASSPPTGRKRSEEEDYGHESFDDMSVEESIEESLDGSNAWEDDGEA